MNSMTGRRPTIAAPMPMPAKPSSAIGVSMTRRGAEAIEHPLADLVGAVVLGHLLAHEEDAVVPLHLLGHRLVERLAVRNDGHDVGFTPAESIGGHRDVADTAASNGGSSGLSSANCDGLSSTSGLDLVGGASRSWRRPASRGPSAWTHTRRWGRRSLALLQLVLGPVLGIGSDIEWPRKPVGLGLDERRPARRRGRGWRPLSVT